MATYLPAFLFFVTFYTLVAPFYDGPKKRSWILTALASTFLSSCCIPYAIEYVRTAASVQSMAGSETLAKIFQAYLTADLVMGSRHYPEYLSIVLGWVHHIAYILIAQYCLLNNYTHIFAVTFLMEIPTSLLSLGSLHPNRLRNTVLFAVAFFTTRIVIHLGLIGIYLHPRGIGRVAVGGNLVPAGLFMAAFPMHAVWFTGCVKGFIKRAKARKEAALVAAAELAKSTPVPPADAIVSSAPEEASTAVSSSLSIPHEFPQRIQSRTIQMFRRRIPPHQLQAMKDHVRALAKYLEDTARKNSPSREEIIDFVRERSRPLRKAIVAY